jgi:hypothetical protein
MKIILSSTRHHYLARVSVFLITLALIAGMGACVLLQYNLTMSSTEGGEVATPGEGTFIYFAGTVVGLVAEAEEGYYFVDWTGDIGTISCQCHSTTITMQGDYEITANFAPETSENLEIRDWYDLDAIRDNLDGEYILMNDLDSTTAGYTELASPTANGGKGWQPIGTELYPFTGSFNGQGYGTRDLFINRSDEDDVGLFRFVAGEGVVENIGVVNATVTGFIGVGSLVAVNDGTVSDSYATGSVSGEWFAGGLVGQNNGNVTNSYSNSSVMGDVYVGGLMGVNDGTVSDSFAAVSVSGTIDAGGLVGANYDTVSDCYSSGSVDGIGRTGGLMGGNWGNVSSSYSTSNVTGNEWVGGLVGENGGNVTDSYSTGSVNGYEWVGGLVGENEDTVTDSFWDTETSGQATSAGGTGKNTTEMQDITTFSGAGWNIIAVANPGIRNPSYTWNIVNGVTYPFLSWES